MSFLKEKFSNAINNDKGMFQGGEFVGLKNFANKFKDKPFEGIPGVCPYTGKPLKGGGQTFDNGTMSPDGGIFGSNGEQLDPNTLGMSPLRSGILSKGKMNPYVLYSEGGF